MKENTKEWIGCILVIVFVGGGLGFLLGYSEVWFEDKEAKKIYEKCILEKNNVENESRYCELKAQLESDH